MKPFFCFASLFVTTPLASAQSSQTPIFYPPTEHMVKSEVTSQGKREVIERRRFILLGFLPRTQSGQTEIQTSRITGESRDYSLEAHVKSRDFGGMFAKLKAEALGADFSKLKPKRWKFSFPASSQGVNGWAVIPSNTLRASERCGFISYCTYVERFSIEGSRDSKELFFIYPPKGRGLHYKASLRIYIEGPGTYPLERGRSFDFQTQPTQEQLEELHAHRYGG